MSYRFNYSMLSGLYVLQAQNEGQNICVIFLFITIHDLYLFNQFLKKNQWVLGTG